MRCGIRVSCGMEGQLGMREDKKIFWILRLRVARRDRSTSYKNITSWCHVKGFKLKLEWNKGLFSVLISKSCWNGWAQVSLDIIDQSQTLFWRVLGIQTSWILLKMVHHPTSPFPKRIEALTPPNPKIFKGELYAPPGYCSNRQGQKGLKLNQRG